MISVYVLHIMKQAIRSYYRLIKGDRLNGMEKYLSRDSDGSK